MSVYNYFIPLLLVLFYYSCDTGFSQSLWELDHPFPYEYCNETFCIPRCNISNPNDALLRCRDTLFCVRHLRGGGACEKMYNRTCQLPMECIDNTCCPVKLHDWYFYNLTLKCDVNRDGSFLNCDDVDGGYLP